METQKEPWFKPFIYGIGPKTFQELKPLSNKHQNQIDRCLKRRKKIYIKQRIRFVMSR